MVRWLGCLRPVTTLAEQQHQRESAAGPNAGAEPKAALPAPTPACQPHKHPPPPGPVAALLPSPPAQPQAGGPSCASKSSSSEGGASFGSLPSKALSGSVTTRSSAPANGGTSVFDLSTTGLLSQRRRCILKPMASAYARSSDPDMLRTITQRAYPGERTRQPAWATLALATGLSGRLPAPPSTVSTQLS